MLSSVMGSLRRMEQYIAALPKGLDSYPECQQKGSIFRSVFAGFDTSTLADALPPELARLVRSPPQASEWVHEGNATAIYLAAADVLWGDELFVTHAYKNNYALLDSTMYRILFRLVGARRLLTKAASSWALFHKGTSMSLREFDERAPSAVLELDAPVNHVPRLLVDGYGTALRAATEIAGHSQVDCVCESYSDTVIRFRVRWK
ncbi:MAG: hypothetical protein JNK05_35695 [Myxococcales bacterium]|nr:hypothetical protein [Myxococcales bacterium]